MDTKTRLLINRSAVRDYALAVIATDRPHLTGKLTRVSSEFYTRMESQLRNAITAAVAVAPSIGKTLH